MVSVYLMDKEVRLGHLLIWKISVIPYCFQVYSIKVSVGGNRSTGIIVVVVVVVAVAVDGD
jgi:hypothetical protein